MPTINDFLNIEMKEEKEIEFKGSKIKVKQYLPVNEKLKLINNILSLVSQSHYDFLNPIQLKVYTVIEIIRFYTDIELDDELDIPSVYDSIYNSKLYLSIVEAIPEEEIDFVEDGILDTIESFYEYHNSLLGIMKSVTADYSNLDLEASDIQKKLLDPENLGLLREITKKLG